MKKNQTEDSVLNNDNEWNDDAEPNFSDPEDFVDDIADEGEFIYF